VNTTSLGKRVYRCDKVTTPVTREMMRGGKGIEGRAERFEMLALKNEEMQLQAKECKEPPDTIEAATNGLTTRSFRGVKSC
jgi:hypothetical protein